MSPWTTSVPMITQKARKMISSRSGNAPPPSIVSGTAKAAARVTAPRMPVHATSSVFCHGGYGSSPRNFGTGTAGRR